jgi:8-hydroxy-5-deazaflavin:NADPH oxidoreductase
MKIAILGTGDVGSHLASSLVGLGHEVKMGSRTAENAKATEWVRATGPKASHGTFADAASFGEIVFNCTAGVVSVEALKMAGAQNLKGKILIDVSNPLDFSRGMPPTLTVCNTDSVGEQIQRAFPDARVVKALNTMRHDIMTNPSLVPGHHDAFICGDDAAAKAEVTRILKEWFGWKSVIDVGDIAGSRGLEMILPLWLRLSQVYNWAPFNFRIVR